MRRSPRAHRGEGPALRCCAGPGKFGSGTETPPPGTARSIGLVEEPAPSCDPSLPGTRTAMIQYDPHRWLDHLFDVKGSLIREIALWVLSCLIWAVVVVAFDRYVLDVA